MKTEFGKFLLSSEQALAAILIVAAMSIANAVSAAELVQPKQLVVDASLLKAQADAQILAARRYDTFWNNGEEELARTALAADFKDRTLPPGRAQGVSGPIAASKSFRVAVPDLTCEVEQMIVAGDRVVSHLHFRGHFIGRFKEIQGNGQTVDFIATDIYRISDRHIVENWHLEDNLTLLQQLGQIPK